MTTYTNATLVLDGVRVPLRSFSYKTSDVAPTNDALPTLTLTQKFQVETHVDAAAFWPAIQEMFPQFRCWKCHDGRTRSHHRRCLRRGNRARFVRST